MATLSAPEAAFRVKTKAELVVAFTPVATAALVDWVGTYYDLFSPDYNTAERQPWDTAPSSRKFIDLHHGELQVSADLGEGTCWGRRFNPKASVNPVFIPSEDLSTCTTSFISMVPPDAPVYADAQAGALEFEVVMGEAFGCKCLCWSTLYRGKGGKYGEHVVPASACDNFWLGVSGASRFDLKGVEQQVTAALRKMMGEVWGDGGGADPAARLGEILAAEQIATLKARIATLEGRQSTVDPPPLVATMNACNAENDAAFAVGSLKHRPPTFDYFDPTGTETLPLILKEVKLPRAAQSHEVCYEPVTQCIFVSQMSNSVLVRVAIGEDGLLVDDQDAWRVGEQDATTGDGISGMHNLSLSAKHPGHLWISLQYANQLMLVDVRDKTKMLVRQLIEVPTLFTDPTTNKTVHVGGPHCMRECPVTGDIWVGLKGALKDSPCTQRKNRRKSSCCDPEALETNMSRLADRGRNTPLPDGWAVWRVTPSRYDPSASDGACGGQLYPCERSPPMLATDAAGNCWVPQDACDRMLRIDYQTGEARQMAIPFPATGSAPRITGPAVGRAPDGSIWISQLGSYNALVRIDPMTEQRVLYEFGGPEWCRNIRLIHLTFSKRSGRDSHNRIYALASDLLDEEAINALVVLRMTDDWKMCLGRRVLPLPTQDCACHRVAFVDPHTDAESAVMRNVNRSVVITELSSSKVLQVKVQNLIKMTLLKPPHVETDKEGFEVHKYEVLEEEEGEAC